MFSLRHVHSQMFAYTVTGIGSAYGFAMSTPDGPGIFTPDVIAWTTAFLSLSLVTNLITTRECRLVRHAYYSSLTSRACKSFCLAVSFGSRGTTAETKAGSPRQYTGKS